MPDGTDRIVLAAPGVEAVVDPAMGGRIAALRVDGLDLVLTEGFGPISWGAYPMAPWAGRLRDGILPWRGRAYRLERTMPPHAIHGTTWTAPWTVASVGADGRSAILAIDLAPAWPLGGRAVHRVELDGAALRCTLEVHAGDVPMPAIAGWHPWFPRRLARGGELELSLPATGMLRRGEDGLPTGEIVPVTSGPWDDAFLGLTGAPRVRWPGAITLEVRSAAPVWVVYTEQPHAIAVEPQTGPPNGLSTGECDVVEPGAPLVATMTLTWAREA